jgi:hypothetical protein
MYSINSIYFERGHIPWSAENGEVPVYTNK